MKPIYTPQNTTAAYQLNWAVSIFWRERKAPPPESTWLDDLRLATEPDGVRILNHRFKGDLQAQLLCGDIRGV